jgi:putative membrane protein
MAAAGFRVVVAHLGAAAPQGAGDMTIAHKLTEAERAQISEAVHSAEADTSGEIVPIIAERSDQYRDIALIWSAVAGVLALTALALFPEFYQRLLAIFSYGWISEWSAREALEIALAVFVIKFGAMYLLLQWWPLRRFLTPGRTKAKRVRARAIDLFRVSTDARTTGRTGILIYLSLAERRAEIVADQAIHARVDDGVWGEAMVTLIGHVGAGRVGEGMAAAIADVGAILSLHLPRAADDANELPDRVVEL